MTTQDTMLILDFIPQYEGTSEGRIINEFVNILNVQNKDNIYIEYHDRPPRKEDILDIFHNYEWDYIHIAAHGTETAFHLPFDKK